MLTNKTGRRVAIRAILFAFFLCQGGICLGAINGGEDEPTPGELLNQSRSYMRTQEYDLAIDSMYAYLEAVDGTKSHGVIVIAQDVRYKLATVLISQNRHEEAIEILERYVNEPLAQHMRRAMKMLVACYFENVMYEECIPAVTNALYYNENPVVVAKVIKGRDIDEFDPFADEEEEEEDPDPPYTQNELTMLHFSLGESYYNIGKWEECIEPFTYVSEHTKDDLRKGYSIMQMIKAFVELGGFERIIAWVPELYRTNARYDIRVNLALLKAAAALYEAKEYDSALPLYRMIIPRGELLEYQEGKLREMRIAAGLPPEAGEAMTDDEILLFGEQDAGRTATDAAKLDAVALAGEGINPVMESERPPELIELEGLVGALKSMEPYENHVDFQMAQLYREVERYWESIRFFDKVHGADPTSEVGKRAIYEAVSTLTNPLKAEAEAESRATSYLDTYNEGLYPRLVAYVLTSYYQRQRAWKSIDALNQYVAGFVPTNDTQIIKFDTELYFMQGVADLMLQDYTNALANFEFVVEEFPGTEQEATSLFWSGFSYLCLDRPKDAFTCFERYTHDFPEGPLLDEAYYQGGISLFGLDELDKAKERFTYVIERFGTNSPVYPESCNMRGDILGSEGGDGLDAAISDYKNAFNAATKASQATYATFKMCDIYKADEQFYGSDHVLKAVDLYLAEWGDRGGDIAKALFWKGRTKIQQGQYEEAATSYLEAILDYGYNLRQDGVDLMLPELAKIANMFLGEEERNVIVSRLKNAMETTDSKVLALRLRVALAKFDGTEAELGKQLLQELDDLEDASPPVLAAICEASFALGDYSRAEELLRTFKNKFEESIYMRSAYKLRALGQFKSKDFEGAMETIASTQSEYGTERDVAWAQLMKARILLEQGKIDEAREANKDVMGVPEWRGAPVAEAIFQLGQVEEQAGNPRLAHAFFQRAYFQYKGHSHGYWAAEGYLAAARCLLKMAEEPGLDPAEKTRMMANVRNTYRAMLFDSYINQLPQADVAREYLGADEVAGIQAYIDSGSTTNITVSVNAPEADESGTEPAGAVSEGGDA